MSTESDNDSVTLTRNRAIGCWLGVDRKVGDKVTAECSNGSVTAEIYEVPDDVPTEANQTKEILAQIEDSEDIVGLYCHVMEMNEWDARYDVYAVRMSDDGENTNLGEIQSLEVLEE